VQNVPGKHENYDPVEKSLIIGEWVELEVRKFSYLGDMLVADGVVDSAVTSSQLCMEQV
jgi:hypothetical protein